MEPLNKSLRTSAGSFSDCRRQIPFDVAMLRLRVLFLVSRKNLSTDARIDLISDSYRIHIIKVTIYIYCSHARGLQAFLQDEADEAGALPPGHRLVEQPRRSRRGRKPESEKIHRPGTLGRRLQSRPLRLPP